MKIILIGVLAFTAVALLEAIAYTMRFLSDRREDELKRRLSAVGSVDGTGTRAPGLLRRDKFSSNAALDAFLRSLSISARLDSLLEQTELEITVGTLLGLCLAGLFTGLLLGVAGGSGGVMTLVLGGVIGFLPIFYVQFKRAQRSRRLSEQLPDALEMMARSLRAGHALSSAFKMVATEMPTPVSIEFARAFEAQELGMPFEKAVSDMTRRAPDNQDLKIFALSVIVQKETGGNLVEIIEKISETIRSRYKFQGKLRGLTAEGRMSSYVVGGLPFVSALVMLAFNREYIMRLFKYDAGRYIIGYGAFSWTVGFLMMKKMMKIKM